MQCLHEIRRVLYAGLLLVLALLATPVFSQTEKTQDVPSLLTEIERIKAEKPSMVRYKGAQQLLDSVKAKGSQNVTEREIEALTGMMADQDDSIRYWIATALGYVGPRAKLAVPNLEAALKEVECSMSSKTSASSIRSALEKIGVEPSVGKCPIIANGYSNDIFIAIVDRGNRSTFNKVAPQQCVEIIPDHSFAGTITVVSERSSKQLYTQNDIDNAMKHVHQVNGVLVVNETGISYVNNYKCYHPVK
jgi:hypothetical protein